MLVLQQGRLHFVNFSFKPSAMLSFRNVNNALLIPIEIVHYNLRKTKV